MTPAGQPPPRGAWAPAPSQQSSAAPAVLAAARRSPQPPQPHYAAALAADRRRRRQQAARRLDGAAPPPPQRQPLPPQPHAAAAALAADRRHRRQQAGRHRAARKHLRHLTQHRRRPLVPRQSAAGMGVEAAAPGGVPGLAGRGAARQKGGCCDGGCESNFSVISIQTKDTGEDLEIWNERFQIPNSFRTKNVFNHKVMPLDHRNETIGWFFLQLFFWAKLYRPRNDASFLSRPCDQLLQLCRFPSIHFDRLIHFLFKL
jgi:hypothetical protein